MSGQLFPAEFFTALDRVARRRSRQVGGRAPVPRAGQGRAGFERRPWQWGDDPRRVDWRTSARVGQTLVRRREEDRGGDLLLILDNSASVACGSGRRSQDLRRLALALGWLHLESGGQLRLVSMGVSYPFAGPARRHALRSCLESLSNPNGTLRWDCLPSRGRVVFLTDPWSPAPPPTRGNAHMIRLADHGEEHPPYGELLLIEAESGRRAHGHSNASSWPSIWQKHLRQSAAQDTAQGWTSTLLSASVPGDPAGQILTQAEDLDLV